MVIGLDSAEPSLVEAWRDELPTLAGLMERGVHGRLTSVVPPITVPAWSCMMASRTPGDLGVYGFRNRSDHTYDGRFIADGSAIKAPRLWDLVGRAGGSSIVVGVPGTYPPRPLRGALVTCFLTPSVESSYTYPPGLKDEVADVVGEYMFDVKDFRTENKAWLLEQLYEMTDRRFRLAEHLLATRPWQLFAMVEMGHDRIHHGFWKFMDAEHRKHEPGNAFESAILDYYRHVDGLISEAARARRRGDARARRLRPWREAARRRRPRERVAAPRGPARASGGAERRRACRTRSGSTGRGRPPGGTAATTRASSSTSRDASPSAWSRRATTKPFATTLRSGWRRSRTTRGGRWRPRVYKPEELYDEVNGVAPDLIVVFGDLLWRSVATIGGDEGVHTLENDTGPDDANHAQDGMIVAAGAGVGARGRLDAHLLDVAPTVLELLGLDVPEDMRGRSLAPKLAA